MANGTSGSDTDTKKASALARIIKKGTLGKEVGSLDLCLKIITLKFINKRRGVHGRVFCSP